MHHHHQQQQQQFMYIEVYPLTAATPQLLPLLLRTFSKAAEHCGACRYTVIYVRAHDHARLYGKGRRHQPEAPTI